MAKRAEVEIKANADSRELTGFRKHLEDLRREVPLLGRAFELLKNPLTILISLMAGLAAGLKNAVAEFAAAEQQSARLDAALARSGQLTEEYRAQLHDLASQLQETTGVADDQWFEVLRKLTQFGADSTNITELAEGVKNLAGFMDGDLATAADLVGRAMQGNFALFSRYGIQAKDLTALLKELAEKGAGQLEAKSQTLAGTWQNLKNQIADLQEGVGGLINRTGILKTALDFAAGAFQFWVEKIGNVQEVLPGLTNAVDRSADAQAASATEARQNARELEFLERVLGRVNDELEEQNKQIERRKDDALKLSNLREDVALAELEATGATGAALARGRLQIKERFAAERLGIERTAGQERVAAGQAQVDKQTAVLEGIDKRISELVDAVKTGEKLQATNDEIAALEARRKEIASTLQSVAGFSPALDAQLGVPALYGENNAIATRLRQISRTATTLNEDRAQLAALQGVRGATSTNLSTLRAGLSNTVAAVSADVGMAEKATGFSLLSAGIRTEGQLRGEAATGQAGLASAAKAEAQARGLSQINAAASRSLAEQQATNEVILRWANEQAEANRRLRSQLENRRDQ